MPFIPPSGTDPACPLATQAGAGTPFLSSALRPKSLCLPELNAVELGPRSCPQSARRQCRPWLAERDGAAVLEAGEARESREGQPCTHLPRRFTIVPRLWLGAVTEDANVRRSRATRTRSGGRVRWSLSTAPRQVPRVAAQGGRQTATGHFQKHVPEDDGSIPPGRFRHRLLLLQTNIVSARKCMVAT